MSSEAGLPSSADHLTALLLGHMKCSFMSVLSSSEYDESDQVIPLPVMMGSGSAGRTQVFWFISFLF